MSNINWVYIAFLKFSLKNSLKYCAFNNTRTRHLKFKQRFPFSLPPIIILYVSENEKDEFRGVKR